jgi:hypothetical protein
MGYLLRKEGERRPVHRQGDPPKPLGAAGAALKVEVAAPGIVELPLPMLREHGLAASGRALQVWSQGRPVPSALRSGSNGTIALVFAASALTTDYTGRNVYVVTEDAKAVPLRVPLTRSAAPETPGSVHVEKNTIYLAQAPLGTDPWLWENLVPEWGEWPYAWWDPTAGDFDIPGLQPGLTGPVRVRVRLLGFSEDEHHVEARINGQPVGDLVWSGRTVATLEGTVMAEALQAGGNVLSLSYRATTLGSGDADPWASAYVNALEIDVPTAPGTAVVPVAAASAYERELPSFNGTEYLIVTHSRFAEQAAQIAALKQAEGLRTEVVSVEQAYDYFSAGIVEARGIKALVAEARRRSKGRLGYVLLVGDDSFDTHDYVGSGTIAFVPSLLGWDGEFGRIPSENPYADTDDDGSPDVAIGRLPVQTTDEADALVAKIAGQAQTLKASAGRHLFVTDNSGDEDAPFRDEADAVRASLAAGAVVLPFADATLGADAARRALQEGWRTGAALTHYFGHGGPTVWADEEVLSVDTVGDVTGSGRPTVLFTWACLSQFYQYFWGPSINEALLLLPSGGTLASFGPAGISSPGSQQPLVDAVYRNLRSGVRLGDLVRRAKAEALRTNPQSTAKVVEGFNLLGDPALRLP